MSLNLSKSKYCSAVQCPKMLWLKKNKPEEFDESVMNQTVLDNGNKVGDLAMGMFGDFVEVPFGDFGGMIAKTKELMDAGEKISDFALERCVDLDASAFGNGNSENNTGKRGFTCAVFTDYCQKFTFSDVKAHIIKCQCALVVHGDIFT